MREIYSKFKCFKVCISKTNYLKRFLFRWVLHIVSYLEVLSSYNELKPKKYTEHRHFLCESKNTNTVYTRILVMWF